MRTFEEKKDGNICGVLTVSINLREKWQVIEASLTKRYEIQKMFCYWV
jgi:hypothetical protein